MTVMTANRAMRLMALAAPVAPFRLAAAPPPPLGPLPDQVAFLSADGRTKVSGLCLQARSCPSRARPGRGDDAWPRRRTSSLADGRYDASTLSPTTQKWGHSGRSKVIWQFSSTALVPRGFPHGFAAGTHDQRPANVNEVTVRPLDAYGALVYLRTPIDVLPDRIAPGVVKRRERYPRHDVVIDTGIQSADAYHRLPRCGRILSGLQP